MNMLFIYLPKLCGTSARCHRMSTLKDIGNNEDKLLKFCRPLLPINCCDYLSLSLVGLKAYWKITSGRLIWASFSSPAPFCVTFVNHAGQLTQIWEVPLQHLPCLWKMVNSVTQYWGDRVEFRPVFFYHVCECWRSHYISWVWVSNLNHEDHSNSHILGVDAYTIISTKPMNWCDSYLLHELRDKWIETRNGKQQEIQFKMAGAWRCDVRQKTSLNFSFPSPQHNF